MEIAKANAAAMCAKVGMPIPASLRSAVLPLALPSMDMNAAVASMTAGMIFLFFNFSLHNTFNHLSSHLVIPVGIKHLISFITQSVFFLRFNTSQFT